MDSNLAIRRLGTHRGKQLYFGWDVALAGALDDYLRLLAQYGIPMPAVNPEQLHHLTSAQRVCERVQARPGSVGVLVDATGMGSAIAANKFRGIYAARCLTVADAQEARAQHNANVLCLSARVSVDANTRIVEAFMTTAFEGTRLAELEYVTCLELESDPAPRARSA